MRFRNYFCTHKRTNNVEWAAVSNLLVQMKETVGQDEVDSDLQFKNILILPKGHTLW